MTSWFEQPMIAYDHSQLSQIALDIFLDMKKKFTKSHIIHVLNSSKNGYVLHTINTATIEQHLKEKFPASNKDNTTIQLRQQGNKSVNQIILESFISSGTNLLFLGQIFIDLVDLQAQKEGSQEPKIFHPELVNLSMKAKSVWQLQFQIQNQIKRQSPQAGNVVFCFDGSEIAVSGLMKANQFCVTYGKNLTIIHCTNPQLKTHTKHIKNQIKGLKLQNKDLKFDFVVEQSMNLIDWIKQIENELDWVIITSNGYRGETSKMRFVGHTATIILEEVNVNTFLIKL